MVATKYAGLLGSVLHVGKVEYNVSAVACDSGTQCPAQTPHPYVVSEGFVAVKV